MAKIWRVLFASVLSASALLGCTTLQFVDVISDNQGGRIAYIVIHFTSEDFAESLRLLTERTERPVSSHYLVPQTGDPTYSHRHLKVYRLVDEDQRAWHAGPSHWRGHTDLNSRSIGVEVVNLAKCTAEDQVNVMDSPATHCEFPRYDEKQIDLLVSLLRDILKRHPTITPDNILAHSDIAIDRKLDPGPSFPWKHLYDHGIGAWYDEDTVQKYLEHFSQQVVDLRLLQSALAAYGYDVQATGKFDKQTEYAIRAFQLHFRPSDWTGQPDANTVALVFALLEKYRPQSLVQLSESSTG